MLKNEPAYYETENMTLGVDKIASSCLHEQEPQPREDLIHTFHDCNVMNQLQDLLLKTKKKK